MLLLYGANGYTGELMAEEAARVGLPLVLAGRRADAIQPIAARLGIEHRIFPLGSGEQIASELDGISTVLLAAGPFAHTSAPMLDACIRRGAHYLDITGEIAVFEACKRRGEEARAAGVMVLPGVGFDVVPTDCLAASLHESLPDATHLELAFGGGGGFSRGTAKTMVSGLGQGGAVRENGRIRRVPTAWKTREVPYRDRARLSVSIPWGDVSTGFTSTGIPNIITYMAMPPGAAKMLRRSRPFGWLLASGPVQRFLLRRIEQAEKGPSAEVRASARMQVWGEVRNAAGDRRSATLTTPEGYRLTAIASIEAARRVLADGSQPGYRTPSRAFGATFVSQLEGCDLRMTT